jgi:hypothetical protein
MAQFVALDIGPVLGELDGATPVGRAVVAGHKALHYLAGHQRKTGEAVEDLGIQDAGGRASLV